MALHVKTNLEITVINKVINPEMFHDLEEGAFEQQYGMKLEVMQKLVGGDIQMVVLKKPVVLEGVRYVAMIMNEEGKLSGMRFNAVATKLAKLDNSIMADDVIVGDVVLLEHLEMN